MRKTRYSSVLALMLAAVLAAAGVAWAAAVPTNSAKLRNAVTVAGIMEHENKFQAIADANDDNRASGTPGFDASAAYVAGKLRAAGYEVTVQPFTFMFFQELGPTSFSQTAPNATTYTDGGDFSIMEYSGSGNVVDTVVVPTNDVQIPPVPTASSSNSGCEASDFPAETDGAVALVQRGTCDFVVKARNAQDAGAVAVIIFNEGQEGRTEVLNGTLGGPDVTIPVIGTTFAVGEELYNASGSRVSISTSTRSENRQTSNVIAGAPPAAPTAWPSRARTSTPFPRVPASTTTARGRPRSSRSWRRWPSSGSNRATGSASPSGAPKSRACSAPSTTWAG